MNIPTYTSYFIEIQQKDNETLAAYVHYFKMEAKRCNFNSDTATICIFVKGFWDAHNITAKVYENDAKTLSEVIKLVHKLNLAQQVTATLSPPTVNMMLNDERCFICSRMGHIGHHCPNTQCYNCNGSGHFAQDCPGKFPHQEHLITMRDHAPAHVTITTTGTDNSLSITDTARENVLTDQDHSTNLNAAGAPATTRGMHLAPYLTTAAACDTHPPTDALYDTLAQAPHTITVATHP